MKVYGAVSSAEDSPLLKRNTNKSETSSHFKRIAAATLLAGGAALAVASKNTNYSSSFAIGGRNFHRVRGLGDALDDAKAGTLFYRFCALLEIKKRNISSRRESFRRALPFADRKNTAKRDSKREATRVFYRSTRFDRIPSFCMRCSRARREIQFSGFPWFCNTLLEFRVLVVK
jgi:hypothetical protein